MKKYEPPLLIKEPINCTSTGATALSYTETHGNCSETGAETQMQLQPGPGAGAMRTEGVGSRL